MKSLFFTDKRENGKPDQTDTNSFEIYKGRTTVLKYCSREPCKYLPNDYN